MSSMYINCNSYISTIHSTLDVLWLLLMSSFQIWQTGMQESINTLLFQRRFLPSSGNN